VPETAFAVWITGLPASGKSTITSQLQTLLQERGIDIEVLESDVLRQQLGGNYDEAGREAFYQRMVWIGTLLVKHGVPVIFDATANRRAYRDAARTQIPQFFDFRGGAP
jgi:adenylylsulfate kinase